jgi:hypothetical protein
MRILTFTLAFCFLLTRAHSADELTKEELAALMKVYDDDLPAKDGWSKSVKGIQARLVFGAGKMESGTWRPTVYIEFHNLRRSMGNVEFWFYAGRDLKYALRDVDGHEPKRPGLETVDALVLGGARVILPHDATLRMPITWWGHGSPADFRMALDLEQSFWEIPKTDLKDYFLSAVLTIEPFAIDPSHFRTRDDWSGKIEIPPVKAEIPK